MPFGGLAGIVVILFSSEEERYTCVATELKKRFGKRLQYLRNSKNLTQQRLAELVGRSPNFISMLENGDSTPSFKTLVKLAKALNVEVMELFRFDDE